jgi:hypothetical protein
MRLGSFDHTERKQPVDLPCVAFRRVPIVVIPAKAIVGFTFVPQQVSPDTFVMRICYGESWPGSSGMKKERSVAQVTND